MTSFCYLLEEIFFDHRAQERESLIFEPSSCFYIVYILYYVISCLYFLRGDEAEKLVDGRNYSTFFVVCRPLAGQLVAIACM